MSFQSFELDTSITDENLTAAITEITHRIRPDFNANNDKLVIQNLSGGITNRLVACYPQKSGLNTRDTILFRLYGKHTENFISRDDEIATMKILKKHDLGPQLYCKFSNGIAYEFLPGHILDQNMVNDEKIFTRVAKTFAYFHFIDFDEPTTALDLAKKSNNSKKPFIFPKIYQLLNLVKSDYQANMPHMSEAFLKKIPSLVKLKDEVKQLEDHIMAYTNEKKSLIVLSHNDLLLGNIINDVESEKIKFIDLEYADVNFQAYDIANHFNEYAGVEEPNYSFFPNREYQLKWCEIYLSEFCDALNKLNKSKQLPLVTLTRERIEEFCVEVNKFTLASHLMWGIWSLVQAQSSQLEFDFVNYANVRFEEFFRNKERIFNL
jgi:ethanolamine kinase